MGKGTDIRVRQTELYFLPVQARMPLKFGTETLYSVTCARGRVVVESRDGRTAEGWGETPLSVQWVWPSTLPYSTRLKQLKELTSQIGAFWPQFDEWGHPIEICYRFTEQVLPQLLAARHHPQTIPFQIPKLAALLCASVWDQAIHDSYGNLLGRPTYSTYNQHFMNYDLASYLEPAENSQVSFRGLYPDFYLRREPKLRLLAWHLVGGLDPIYPSELTGSEPNDGYPVLLEDWIRRDGLRCLKIKLRGNDYQWDYERLIQIGRIAIANNVIWLSADFNCTVTEPSYVNEILDRLRDEYPRVYGMLLYVEQPFPYDLEQHLLDVHSVSSRKPLFLDESAHDWRLVKLGRRLGWTGVALKTCKTQSGAILTGCWALAHGMGLMVQDLTNPMLAQIPHLLLAAYFPTIMGVETNSMQFYPEASSPEAEVHPGMYQRKEGMVDLSTIGKTGFGYRLTEIKRRLPDPVGRWGS